MKHSRRPDLMHQVQQAAIEYVAAGLHILALSGKKPNGRVHGESWSWEDSFWSDTELTPADWEAIEQAFDPAQGTTGIAILIPEDFVVADVDTDDAAELLLSLGYAPDEGSIVAKTRNGLHIWFWAPGISKNRWLTAQFYRGHTKVEQRLLFKGFGGYVVAPPSEHPDGGTYAWGTPLVADGKRYMPDILPEQAREKFAAEDQFAAAQPPKEKMTTFHMEPVEGVPWWQWPVVMEYRLAGLEHAIETAADGNQNNVIHWAALTAKEEGVPFNVAMDRLMAAAERGHHPKDRASDTIKGAYKRRRG